VYGLLLLCLTPLFVLHLLLRSRRQAEYLQNLGERFGRYPPPTSTAPHIWIHAVSVGETRAAEPLLQALRRRYPDAVFIMTHTTPTGRAVPLPASLPIERVYLPYDYAFAVRRFIETFKPVIGILMETEVWPNLTFVSSQMKLPVALVNARLSEKSLRRGLRFKILLGPALRRLAVVLAQSRADAERLVMLGARAPQVVGNIKFDQDVPPAQLLLGRSFRGRAPHRRVVLAASTREGEEALLLAAWKSQQVPDDVLLVIVPRHPQRFEDVAALIEQHGMRYQRRSEASMVAASCQIMLGDSMGEMLAYYASADVAYVGGGLLPFGTHNLIEACAVGCPVLIGPHYFNFAEATKGAVHAGAAILVANATEVVRQAMTLLEDPPLRQRYSLAAKNFAMTHQGAAAACVKALAPMLDLVLK
jgi:3-deoxy-D-manno-octulosonic-acid transferase